MDRLSSSRVMGLGLERVMLSVTARTPAPGDRHRACRPPELDDGVAARAGSTAQACPVAVGARRVMTAIPAMRWGDWPNITRRWRHTSTRVCTPGHIADTRLIHGRRSRGTSDRLSICRHPRSDPGQSLSEYVVGHALVAANQGPSPTVDPPRTCCPRREPAPEPLPMTRANAC